MGDIEKAFHQISLAEKDRNFTKFLWLKNIDLPMSNDNIAHMRFARVPFGVIASPLLLAATMEFHLKQVNTPVSQEIRQNIYVDKILLTASDAETACYKYEEARKIFYSIHMNLRECCSNNPRLNKRFWDKDIQTSEIVKFLGIEWSPTHYTFQVQLPCTPHSDDFNTKR